MTKREVIKAVLDGKKPPYVPWSFKFTIEPKQMLCKYYGVEDLDMVLGNHILQLGDDIGFFNDLGNDQFQDVFKVIWDRSIDKDIVDAKGIVLPEPTLEGYDFPYHQMARIMHEHGGICFIDFSASAPYVDINMHPEDPFEKLDGIYFSPHKFLGGPGSSGVLIFDSRLYTRNAPVDSGGGTGDWTNPWGDYKYVDNIEMREDGGTPGFLQAIRSALAIQLKQEMGTVNIEAREKELINLAFMELRNTSGIEILAEKHEHRLGIISFYHPHIHYNLIVKLLSDKFGIQVRGGCACAGTYGHYLLEVSYQRSLEITKKISYGDLSEKPGWVRLSLHPTLTDEEIRFFGKALREIVKNYREWRNDYTYHSNKNEYRHRLEDEIKGWFN